MHKSAQERVNERPPVEGDGDTDFDDDEEEEETYEETRRRLILENQLLLDSLGIQPTASSSSLPVHPPSAPRRKRDTPHKTVYDRSGFILSQPGPSEVHRIACVEMPSDRQLKRRIADGEYQDCTHWRSGEDRRWRFGFGRGGHLAPGDEAEVGDVGEDFRWRRWGGLERELRREMRKRGLLNERDARPPPPPEPAVKAGVSAYHLLPGEACHQCKRKSEKLKMRCRNVNPICRAVFCETCCKRYSYFQFDSESRSFICPLCKDCCNCANCIRKRNLAHLLGPSGVGIRTKSLSQRIRREGSGPITVQAWLEKAVVDQVGVPFDRVRLVDQSTDVLSPELPPEEVTTPIKIPKEKKKRKLDGPQRAGVKGTKPLEEISLVVKLKVPPQPTKPVQVHGRVKEVDSDGDTVGGWSSDEDGAVTAASSSLSSLTPSPVPHRLAFPARPAIVPPNTNDYLSRLANPGSAFYPTHDPLDTSLNYPTFDSFSPAEAMQQSYFVDGRLSSLQPGSSPTLSAEALTPGAAGQNDSLPFPSSTASGDYSGLLTHQSLATVLPPAMGVSDAQVPWQTAPPIRLGQSPSLPQDDLLFPPAPTPHDSWDPTLTGASEHGNASFSGFQTYQYSQVSLETATTTAPSEFMPPSLGLAIHNDPPPYSHSPRANPQNIAERTATDNQQQASSASSYPAQRDTSSPSQARLGGARNGIPFSQVDLQVGGAASGPGPGSGPGSGPGCGCGSISGPGCGQDSGTRQHPQNLDLLSIAASEARHSPGSVDSGRGPEPAPGPGFGQGAGQTAPPSSGRGNTHGGYTGYAATAAQPKWSRRPGGS